MCDENAATTSNAPADRTLEAPQPRPGAAPQPRPRRRRETVDVVYGEINDSLVFIPRARALELQAIHAALWTSPTWGAFRARIPAKDFSAALEYFDEAHSFEEFCTSEQEDEPDLTADEAWRRYRALPIGSRLPLEDDPFAAEQIGWVFDGDWPEWPAQAMERWMPRWIQRRFGRFEDSMLNGDCLTFAPSRATALVAALEKAGYRCERDEDLVARASGYGG